MNMQQVSQLRTNPRSRVVERGYLNVYSQLDPKEQQALEFTRRYKTEHPAWDNTSIVLCHEFADFLQRFHQHSPADPVILDAGCGHGNYVIDEYRKDIAWACGVDIDARFTGRNVCLDEIKIAPLTNIPYPDQAFDAVLALWVVEHLAEPRVVFQEIRRVLKPGGSFIFCTPNEQSWLVMMRKVLGSRVGKAINRRFYGRHDEDIFPTLYRANNQHRLSQELQAAGFSIQHMTLNYDPGYTAFNNAAYRTSTFAQNTVGKLLPTLSKPHIIVHAITK